MSQEDKQPDTQTGAGSAASAPEVPVSKPRIVPGKEHRHGAILDSTETSALSLMGEKYPMPSVSLGRPRSPTSSMWASVLSTRCRTSYSRNTT